MKKVSAILFGISCLSMTHTGIAQPTGPNYGQSFDRSKQNIQTGDYVAAESNAQKSLLLAKTTDEKGDALMLLGEVFYKRKMYEQARSQWSQAAQLDDADSDFKIRVHNAFASSYLAEGNVDKAATEYKSALAAIDADATLDKEEKVEGRSVILLSIGKIYFKSQQFGLAREQYQQILDSNKDDIVLSSTSLFRIGQIDFIQNNLERALAEFKQLSLLKGANPVLKKYAQSQIKLLNSNSSAVSKVKRFRKDLEIGKVTDDIYDGDF